MAQSRSPYAHGRSEIHERKGLVGTIRRERARLGQRLRELRIARKMTQAQAAEAAGVHTVHVARIESGTANVTISTLVAFAVAYDVPVHAFFDPPPSDDQGDYGSVAEPPSPRYALKRKRRRRR